MYILLLLLLLLGSVWIGVSYSLSISKMKRDDRAVQQQQQLLTSIRLPIQPLLLPPLLPPLPPLLLSLVLLSPLLLLLLLLRMYTNADTGCPSSHLYNRHHHSYYCHPTATSDAAASSSVPRHHRNSYNIYYNYHHHRHHHHHYCRCKCFHNRYANFLTTNTSCNKISYEYSHKFTLVTHINTDELYSKSRNNF